MTSTQIGTCKGCGAPVVPSNTITTEDGETFEMPFPVATKTCDCLDDCDLELPDVTL